MSLRPLLRSPARPVVPGRRPQPTLVRPYSQQPRNPYSRTGNDFKDDSHLPLFQRRVPQWSIVEKYIQWYFLGFAIPVTLLTAGYMEWTREEREDAQIYSDKTFTTRFRLPTKTDPKNVREDVWKVISKGEAERVLRRDETSLDIEREGNIVKRIDTSSTPANAPIEDREAHAVLSGEGGDSSFFAVFDGHSGFRTSDLLSKTLLPTLSLALAPSAPAPSMIPSTLSVAGLKRLAGLGPKPTIDTRSEVERTIDVIKASFEALDDRVVWDPVRLLRTGSTSKEDGYASLLPALSGSCALVSYIPPDQSHLYVALAGDCRAVAGYWVPSTVEGEEGKWKVRVLSEDQTGRSEKEAKRLQGEHPGEEVVRRGRVLGGLEPSRAFGDARYKWTREVQEQLYQAFVPTEVEGKQPRPTPPLSKTPPYVTARPEVTSLPIKDASSKDGQLRFLVLATDGLYDRLSNEAIVGLVGTYLSQPTAQGPIPKSDILARVISTDGEGFDGKKATVKARKDSTEGGFIFGRDSNAATLLIRNSLAGADEKHMRELLSVKSPITRFMRDDTTVKVVFFNDRPTDGVASSTPPKSWTSLFWRRTDE